MAKFLTIAVIAGTVGLVSVQGANARWRNYCYSACPSACTPAAAPATAPAPTPPAAAYNMPTPPAPQTAQGAQTYRSFSSEPSAQPQVYYTAPARRANRLPQYLIPKSDPRKYSAY